MAGDNQTLTTLLMAGAVIGTGGAALAAAPSVAAGTSVLGSFGTTLAASAGTLSTIGTVSSIGLIGVGTMAGIRAAEEAKIQLQEQQEQEKTAFALENEQREKDLRSILSSADAAFSSRGVSLGSGTPLLVGQTSTSEFNRESRIASLGQQFSQSGLSSSIRAKSSEATASAVRGVTQGVSLLNRPS